MLPVQHPQHGAASLGTATSPRGWGCWDPPVSPPQRDSRSGCRPTVLPWALAFLGPTGNGVGSRRGKRARPPSLLPSFPAFGICGRLAQCFPVGGGKTMAGICQPHWGINARRH